jgi:transposase
MFDRVIDSDHERNQQRLRQLQEHFDEEEQRILSGEDCSEPCDGEKLLFDEYMTLHLRYGERRPHRESGLVHYYRKLLRLPDETGT